MSVRKINSSNIHQRKDTGDYIGVVRYVDDDGEIKRKSFSSKTKSEAQQKINKLGASADKAGSTMAAFARMEEKIERMTDEADAMAELDSGADDVDTLAAKYDSDVSTSSVDDDLAALKASLGM